KAVADRRLETVELAGQAPARVRQKFLPNPPVPPEPGALDRQGDCFVRARDLGPGRYTPMIDGKPVHTADPEPWMKPGGRGPAAPGRGAGGEAAPGRRRKDPPVLLPLAAGQRDVPVRLPQARTGTKRRRNSAVRPARRRGRGEHRQTARAGGAYLRIDAGEK